MAEKTLASQEHRTEVATPQVAQQPVRPAQSIEVGASPEITDVDTSFLSGVESGSGISAASPDPAADSALAAQVYGTLSDGVGYGTWDLANPSQVFEALDGRSPAQLQAIRAHYFGQTGRVLEEDVRSQFDGTEQNDMMGRLRHGMSIQDKVAFHDTSGALAGEIDRATPEQREALATDPTLFNSLTERMDSKELMEARLKLFPDRAYDAVRDRILDTNHIVNDDESAAMTAFQNLSLSDRRTMLAENPEDFAFLGKATLHRMGRMAESESKGLLARMSQATSGDGTDDVDLPHILADAGRLLQEERVLKAQVEEGTLSADETKAAQTRLDELDGVAAVLEPQRNRNGELDGASFLGLLQGDVQNPQLHAQMRSIGISKHEVAKQQIVDAVGFFDDERGIQEAFAAIPIADRAALWDDPHVTAAISHHLNDGEATLVKSFRDNDVATMSTTRIDAAQGWFTTDKAAMISSVMDMNATDRKAYAETRSARRATIKLNTFERRAWEEGLQSGTLSFKTGVEAATRGAGTTEKLLTLVGNRSRTEDTAAFRQGYLLSKSGATPESDAGKAALALYNDTTARMQGDVDDDEYQAELDRMLEFDVKTDLYTDDNAGPNPAALEELKTPEGRKRMADIMVARSRDKMGPDGDGNGGMAAWLSDADETARASHQALLGQNYASLLDGEISETELQGHQLLWEAFGEDHDAMLAAQNAVTDAVVTGVSVTVALAITLASMGVTAGAASAFIANNLMLSSTAGAAGIVSTGELVGGGRFDSFGDAGTEVGVGLAAEAATLGTAKMLRALPSLPNHQARTPRDLHNAPSPEAHPKAPTPGESSWGNGITHSLEREGVAGPQTSVGALNTYRPATLDEPTWEAMSDPDRLAYVTNNGGFDGLVLRDSAPDFLAPKLIQEMGGSHTFETMTNGHVDSLDELRSQVRQVDDALGMETGGGYHMHSVVELPTDLTERANAQGYLTDLSAMMSDRQAMAQWARMGQMIEDQKSVPMTLEHRLMGPWVGDDVLYGGRNKYRDVGLRGMNDSQDSVNPYGSDSLAGLEVRSGASAEDQLETVGLINKHLESADISDGGASLHWADRPGTAQLEALRKQDPELINIIEHAAEGDSTLAQRMMIPMANWDAHPAMRNLSPEQRVKLQELGQEYAGGLRGLNAQLETLGPEKATAELVREAIDGDALVWAKNADISNIGDWTPLGPLTPAQRQINALPDQTRSNFARGMGTVPEEAKARYLQAIDELAEAENVTGLDTFLFEASEKVKLKPSVRVGLSDEQPADFQAMLNELYVVRNEARKPGVAIELGGDVGTEPHTFDLRRTNPDGSQTAIEVSTLANPVKAQGPLNKGIEHAHKKIDGAPKDSTIGAATFARFDEGNDSVVRSQTGDVSFPKSDKPDENLLDRYLSDLNDGKVPKAEQISEYTIYHPDTGEPIGKFTRGEDGWTLER